MPTIYVENKPYEVPEGQNVLHACLSLGFDIPYFCWHPAMHSVGACRQCAVKQFKDANDTQGKIVMSCMIPAQEGTRISIDDPEAVRFRRAVIEWLMLNHPHDCPVCDEGGECHLQDMTERCGHVYRRTRFAKRTYRNQYLGPFITHEMNRCIQCYRCVRFYIDYAGGRDLDVFGWHDGVYFGRHRDGLLQSKFSGNLVEVCPTGVFDDKTFAKHYTRKWDLQTAPSVCVHCGLGCNTIPGERYGVLRRIRNRYNGDVNGYFLCDRGRFGYEFVNSPQRIKSPLTRDAHGRFVPLSAEAALATIGQLVKDSDRLVGIGSARASLESNFALRTLVGPENFFIGMTDAEVQLLARVTDILQKGPVAPASLSEVGSADAVLILGEDVSNVAPMLELSLRRSILQKPSAIAKALHIALWNDAAVRTALQTEKGPLFIATTHGTDLDAAATATYHAAPQDIARLGFAVANKLDAGSPPVPDLSGDVDSLAQRIAEQLSGAERPLVLSGTSGASSSLIEAAANVAYALHQKNPNTHICFAVPWCNSMGLGLMGHQSVESVIQAVKSSEATTVIVLEDNVYRHLDAAQADDLLYAANHVITLDHLQHETTAKSALALPAATFAESTGTFVNNEGRAQRFFRVFNPDGAIRDSWRWIGDIMFAAGQSPAPPWPTYDDIVRSLSQEMPVFAPVARVAPPASFRIKDQLIHRQPHRSSGRTALVANVTVHEPQTPPDPDAPLSFSMEGYEGQAPPSLITEFWAPGWNSVQSVNKYQDGVGGPIRGGNPGLRLIEPHARPGPGYFAHIPPAFARREGCLLIVPGYHIFGSEELSVQAPAVAELVAEPNIAVSPEDIGSLVVDEKGLVEVTFSHISHHLPARLAPGVPPGLAVVPMGLPGIEWNGLPVWKKLLRS
jgi:NADH-quinone oxidoreductase subunit G